MPRYRFQDTPLRLGDYWLSQRRDSPAWYRTWYDAKGRRTRRVSLATDDLPTAKERFTAWWIAEQRPQDARPEDVALATILASHYADHASKLESAQQASIAIGLWNDFHGALMVGDLTPQRQAAFVAHLRAKGYSNGYISRILAVGRAALNRAVKQQMLTSAPFIFDVEDQAAKRSKEPKGRPLTIEEHAALFKACRQPHLRTFLLLLTCTLCRPDAALDLTPAQVDWDHRLIDLNPKGRRQTKKYRPMVPIAKTLRHPLIARQGQLRDGDVAPLAFVSIPAGKDQFGAQRYRRINSVRTAWASLREDVGLGEDKRVGPYSIRHTMARALRAAGVPQEEISWMLGHKQPGSATTGIYAPYDPSYCRTAVKAIDAYCRRLRKLGAKL